MLKPWWPYSAWACKAFWFTICVNQSLSIACCTHDSGKTLQPYEIVLVSANHSTPQTLFQPFSMIGVSLEPPPPPAPHKAKKSVCTLKALSPEPRRGQSSIKKHKLAPVRKKTHTHTEPRNPSLCFEVHPPRTKIAIQSSTSKVLCITFANTNIYNVFCNMFDFSDLPIIVLKHNQHCYCYRYESHDNSHESHAYDHKKKLAYLPMANKIAQY